MRDFVLVHGGWHGGWVWRDVAHLLREQGHRVFCPTLTGLGERCHLIDSVRGPDTHVDDICNVIRWNELHDIVLLGHSYGGLIITGVAKHMAERIGHLIYLDAFVPTRDGQAPNTMSISSRAQEIAAAVQVDGHVAPTGFERWSASPEKRDWLKRMATPQPGTCFGKGVSLVDDPTDGPFARSYILCTHHDPSPFQQFYQRYRDDPRWTCHTMDCLHDAMVDAPEELVRLITGGVVD